VIVGRMRRIPPHPAHDHENGEDGGRANGEKRDVSPGAAAGFPLLTHDRAPAADGERHGTKRPPARQSRSTAGVLRHGAIVVNDNAEDDYLSYVRDPANGFLGISLPLKGTIEVSVRV
jgi:hypothetical protein